MAAAKLTIVTWKWRPPYAYRSTFTGQHVNILRNMVARNYRKPHEFVCVTDDPTGIDADVRIVPLWKTHRDVISPHGVGHPSCYRRLRMWGRDAADLFGPRFLSIDLDTVLVRDCAPIFDRPERLVLWGDTSPGTPYNGGLILMDAGIRPDVWETFDPVKSPLRGRQARFIGSDQAWIAVVLGPNEAKFSQRDGVFSYRNNIRPNGGRLPPEARLVSFHGAHDPWGPEPQRLEWVRTAYQ
jgi:hypothetical protein